VPKWADWFDTPPSIFPSNSPIDPNRRDIVAHWRSEPALIFSPPASGPGGRSAFRQSPPISARSIGARQRPPDIRSDAPELAAPSRGNSQMSNDKQSPERRALSVKETGEAVGLSRATVYRLIGRKQLSTVKIGSRRLVPVGEIDALLAKAITK
jgi:excisionase family DNA binding protein